MVRGDTQPLCVAALSGLCGPHTLPETASPQEPSGTVPKEQPAVFGPIHLCQVRLLDHWRDQKREVRLLPLLQRQEELSAGMRPSGRTRIAASGTGGRSRDTRRGRKLADQMPGPCDQRRRQFAPDDGENLQKSCDTLKSRLDRLYTDHASGKIDEAYFSEKWNEWKLQLNRAEADRARAVSPVFHDREASREKRYRTRQAGEITVRKGDGPYRARLVSGLLSNPTMNGATVGKDYRFPFWMWANNGGKEDWRRVRDEVQTRLFKMATAA